MEEVLGPVDVERLEAFKGAMTRCRWFLLVTTLISALLIVHVYIERYSFSEAQTREVFRKRFEDSVRIFLRQYYPEEIPKEGGKGRLKVRRQQLLEFLEKNPNAGDVFAVPEIYGLEQLLMEYQHTVCSKGKPKCEADANAKKDEEDGESKSELAATTLTQSAKEEPKELKEHGDFERLIVAARSRLRTNNILLGTSSTERELPLLGLIVPANDYLVVMAGFLLVFVVGVWLNIRSVGAAFLRGKEYSKSFVEILALNFTFTGLGVVGWDRAVAKWIQASALWLPFVSLLFSIMVDLSPIYSGFWSFLTQSESVDGLSLVGGEPAYTVMRIIYLLAVLALVLASVVSSVARASEIDRKLDEIGI